MQINLQQIATINSSFNIKPYTENFDKVLGEVKSEWMHSSTQEVE